VEWSWREARAHGEAINLANGDVIVWRTFFERLASEHGMALEERPLARSASRCASPIWAR
jgi:hypothetical protein